MQVWEIFRGAGEATEDDEADESMTTKRGVVIGHEGVQLKGAGWDGHQALKKYMYVPPQPSCLKEGVALAYAISFARMVELVELDSGTGNASKMEDSEPWIDVGDAGKCNSNIAILKVRRLSKNKRKLSYDMITLQIYIL